MLQPEIDIHILVYNREDFLAQAIESVLTQTFGNFRLLIWDDGSTDRSLEIANRYGADDERVDVVQGPHQGLDRSRKMATEHGSAPFLGWVDSDDLLEPTALEETWKLLRAHPDVGMVYTDYYDMGMDGSIAGIGKRAKVPYSPMRLLVEFMTFHFRLIRRTAFDAAGGISTEAVMADDYDLCMRLSEVTEVAHLKKPLYRYRYHPGAVSWNRRIDQIRGSLESSLRAMKRRGLENDIQFIPDIRAVFSLVPKTKKGAEQLEREFGPPPSRPPATR